jgi:amidohydrolase
VTASVGIAGTGELGKESHFFRIILTLLKSLYNGEQMLIDIKLISDLIPELVTVRQQIHRNPELSFKEYQTADLIVKQLKTYGITEIQTGIGKTGVLAVIDSGKPGKTVALRADMDALPMFEKTGKSYASQNKEIMHACGHDGHLAVLLGAAAVLNKLRDSFKGKIKLIFQPAEEIGAGAQAMITHGALDQVDAIFGWHNMPGTVGQIAVRSGTILAGMDFFKITVSGKGGHASLPQLCVDPVLIGAHLVVALQAIISRRIAATDNAVITVAQFNAGTKENIIPDQAILKGSMRTTTKSQREFLIQEITILVNHIAKGFGAQIEIEFLQTATPTINTPKETELVMDTVRKNFSTDSLVHMPNPLMVSEDFAYFLEKVPGCFFFIGAGVGIEREEHNSHYDFNDEILLVAVRMMSGVALEFLNTAQSVKQLS